ncbi:tetraspanin-33-like [Glandiceps talaboti]
MDRGTHYRTSKDDSPLFCRCHVWVRYCLFVFNIIAWFIGLIFISIGIWARVEKDQLDDLSTIKTDPAVLIILTGCIVFVIAFFGCIGALRQNICLLRTFYVLVIIVFLLQVCIGALTLVFREQVRENVVVIMHRAIVSYRDDLDLQNAVDFVQEELKCCGGISYSDWKLNLYFNCTSPAPSACGVPWSCCKTPDMNSQCGYDIGSTTYVDVLRTIYTTGCIDALVSWVEEHMLIIATVAFCMGLLELVAIVLSHRMIQDILAVQAELDAELATIRAAPEERMLY